MAEQTTRQSSNFIRDFETALARLDSALSDATGAVATIRGFIPQFAALAQVVATIESAVTQARQNFDATPAAVPVSPVAALATSLRAVPVETFPPVEQTLVAQEEAQPAAAAGASQCFRLHVTKTSGTLDLKTVDNALNEHGEIVDLALLDYDGREATLKVWVSGTIDRQSLQESLTADLLQRVGDDAKVKIEFDQESAAA